MSIFHKGLYSGIKTHLEPFGEVIGDRMEMGSDAVLAKQCGASEMGPGTV